MEVVREVWRGGGSEGIEVWMKGWRELGRWGRGGYGGDIWKVDGYWVRPMAGIVVERKGQGGWMHGRGRWREKGKCGEEGGLGLL